MTLAISGTRRDDPIDKLRKLEIYTFANCADKMCYYDRDAQVLLTLGADFSNQRSGE